MKRLIIMALAFFTVKEMHAKGNPGVLLIKTDTVPTRDSTMKDYVSMQAGQMILVLDNKAGKMNKDMKMKDGTVVKTDGTIITKKNGQTFKMKEGDRVYLNGMIEGTGKPTID